MKPAAATDIFDLEKGIELIKEQIKKMKAHQDEHPEDKRLYNALIEERELRLYESLSELEIKRKKPVDKTATESDIVAINLRSGHYRPSIDMNRWRVAEFAWSKAGYKVVRKAGSFLPPIEDREELPPMEKPTEHLAAIEGLDNLIKDLDNLTAHNEILSILKNFPLPTMGGQPGTEDLDDLIADLENLIEDLDNLTAHNEILSVLKNFPLPAVGGQPGTEDLDDPIADLENLIKDLDKLIEDNQAQSRHRIS